MTSLDTVVSLPKAPLRRLVHDCNARFSLQLYESLLQCLTNFLKEVVTQANLAKKLSKRKTFSFLHIFFGLNARGFKFPSEILRANEIEFRVLQKSNCGAIAAARKRSAFSAEISGVTFRKCFKTVTQMMDIEHDKIQITAIHLLHLASEIHLMREVCLLCPLQKTNMTFTGESPESSFDNLRHFSQTFVAKLQTSQAPEFERVVEETRKHLKDFLQHISPVLEATKRKSVTSEIVEMVCFRMQNQTSSSEVEDNLSNSDKKCLCGLLHKILKGMLLGVRVKKEAVLRLLRFLVFVASPTDVAAKHV